MKKMILLILPLFLFAGCTPKDNFDGISKQKEKSEEFNDRTKKEVLYGGEDFLYTGEIDYEDLAREPDKFKGELFLMAGSVEQVMETEEESQYLIIIDNNPENILFCHFIKDNPNYPNKRILEGDFIKFRAGSLGLIDYETSGNSIKTVPNVSIHKIID